MADTSPTGASVLSFDFAPMFSVRAVLLDGEPWFIARDVAEALDYTWNGSIAIGHVPEEWRGVRSVLTPRGSQELVVLSEQGLYFFLGRSDKPKALPFQKWIAGKVLPAIRKTGRYVDPAAPAPAWAANTPTEPIRPKINRTVERLALELFAAGLSLRTIGLQLGISKGTASMIINGVWRFAPNSGTTEITQTLLQQVAQRHEAIEQERIVQKFCSSAVNQELSAVLDATGRRMVAALAGQQP